MGRKLHETNRVLQEMKVENRENEAISSRYWILRFDDEIRYDEKHSKEHFDQIMEDIRAYERYCKDHKDYENNKAVFAIENIETTYKKCAREHTFL